MKTKTSLKRRIINRLKGKKRQIFGDISLPQVGDIYIASYPRSGNTWIRYLLANVLEPSIDWGIDNLNRIIPDIHQKWPADWIVHRPRILKTHHPYRSDYHKAIYVYRDGRDVALSYYDFVIKIDGYKGTFDQFLSDYLNGQVWYGAWHKHLAGWLTENPGLETLAVKYEDLSKDPTSDLIHMCEFLHLPYTEKSIANAITKSSFQRIKKDYTNLKTGAFIDKGTPGIKGGPGKWREVFTSEQVERFWTTAGETASRYGYTKF